MFQLLQPIWLFALAALSIPVIIHLWNQRPGKTLRVGSIALVTENAVSHKKNVRLTEILLLLLRCLLLSCIALALASPIWHHKPDNAEKGWLLMSRQQLAATYNHFKPLVDSLLQTGLEFHYFEDGFEKEKFENALKTAPDTISVKALSYRNITASLNEQVDARLPLYIFTDNYLRNFNGSRSAVSLNIHWFTYTPDTAGVKPFTDTTALHVTIFSRAFANDARYVKAALDAIQEFSKRNIITRQVTRLLDIPAEQDWLFWLDDQEIPGNKIAGNILVYAKGKPATNISFILPGENLSFTAIPLYKSIIQKDSAPSSVDTRWKDGFGHPMLTVEPGNGTVYYRLYTHIDPTWNELPWSGNFPQLLHQLLYAGRTKEALATVADDRIIDSSQLMPLLLNQKEAEPKPAIFTDTGLHHIFWMAACILFFAERCLSFYHRKANANG